MPLMLCTSSSSGLLLSMSGFFALSVGFGRAFRRSRFLTTTLAAVLAGAAATAPAQTIVTGSGIDATDVPRLTERFYRADPARTSGHGGSGLGLAIADSIITRHDGALRIESELGRGTTVTIRLPQRAEAGQRGGEPR